MEDAAHEEAQEAAHEAIEAIRSDLDA